MQPAPQTAMPAARAVAASRARSVGWAWPGGSPPGRPGGWSDGSPRVAGRLAEQLARRIAPRVDRLLCGQLVRAAEQDRGPVTPARGQGQLLFHGGIGHGQQDQVHRPGHVGQRGVAREGRRCVRAAG